MVRKKLRDVGDAKGRAPIGMVHYEFSFAAQLVPDCKCRPNCTTSVPGCRLNIDTAKRCQPPHLAVGNRVHSAAPGQCKISQSRALLHDPQEVKESLLIHRLGRACDVAMTILERV